MNTRRFLKNHAIRHKPGQRGVALIVMLLLLTLLTALSLSMVMVFRSDMFMNAYNRSFRASLYAADAGATIVRQDIAYRLYGMLPAGGPALGAASPLTITNTAASTIVAAINSAYGSPININSTSSFPESFNLQTANTSLTLISCTVKWYTTSTSYTAGATSPNVTTGNPAVCYVPTSPAVAYGFQYTYQYSITTVGTVQGTGGTAATDTGTITVYTDNNDTKNNFSQYGTFIDKNVICSAELVGGTYTGDQFTNGSWNYGQGQTYTFTGKVGSAGADAGYMYNDGTCDQVAGSTDTYNKATISPTFKLGQQLGQPAVALPTDENNQQAAVVTGSGITSNGVEAASPSTATLSADLKDASGTTSYTASTTSGVFVPVSPTTGQVSGGGLWVQGDATVSLSTSGTTAQVYTITQGSPAVTTTVTITPGATPGSGTTVIKKGTNPATTYTGVPTQTNPNVTPSTTSDAVVLYVNGNITSLAGTIQNNTAVTVTAADNITITNNLTYATPVVYTSTNTTTLPSGYSDGSQTAAAAAGTSLQTLGLYTAGGSILLQAPSNGANMEVDASIMTTGSMSTECDMGSSCTGVLGVTGSNTIGTLNIVGGRIQSQAMIMPSGTIGTRNVYFDPRYNGTFAPPFFPVVTNNNLPPTSSVTVQRTGWVLQTAY
ncbi:MAG: hypothetical protein WA532_07245 [Candidatus Korobacteraceae bacterium]